MTGTGGGTAGGAERVTVRVPATSANLGPGYDSFGLALELRDEVVVTRVASGVVVDVRGVGAGRLVCDETHLVVRGIGAAFAAVGADRPGLRLSCTNRIPHGGGQGSSAAAIVSGLLAGRALLPAPSALSDDALLGLATTLEGHPDNVAPALRGGFTLAFTDSTGAIRAIRQDVHPDVRAALFTAAGSSATHVARSLLPATVPHADAAANSARAALLVHALTVDPSWLFEATQDLLHQRYRAPVMPETAALIADLRAAGIPAVVSGAGPSVLVLTSAERPPELFERNGFRVAEIGLASTGGQVRVD